MNRVGKENIVICHVQQICTDWTAKNSVDVSMVELVTLLMDNVVALLAGKGHCKKKIRLDIIHSRSRYTLHIKSCTCI